MRTITHVSKDGVGIKDISKVKIPQKIAVEVFQILNPSLQAEKIAN